jgi:hypothetical protein
VFVHRPPVPVSWVIIVPLGLVFTLFGGAVAGQWGSLFLGCWAVFALLAWVGVVACYWRIVFQVDSTTGTVTVNQGPVWALFSSQYPAAKFSAVAVTCSIRHGRIGEPARVTYFLELQGPPGPVRLAREQDSRAIRYLAEDVGRCLGLDVIDATESPPRVLKADTLGQTLRQAARREGPAASVRGISYPPPPPGLKLDYELGGDRAVFRFPGGGYGCLAGWLPFAVAGVALVGYVGAESRHAGLIAIWSGVIGLPLLVGLAAATPSQVTVEADRKSIRVTTTTLGIPRCREVATDRVREVRRTYKSISIEAREGNAGFGCRALTEEEVEWVRAVLVQVVTA